MIRIKYRYIKFAIELKLNVYLACLFVSNNFKAGLNKKNWQQKVFFFWISTDVNRQSAKCFTSLN